nr:MAG TPA: hypothetical protein [Caudoviricetes sp.]
MLTIGCDTCYSTRINRTITGSQYVSQSKCT